MRHAKIFYALLVLLLSSMDFTGFQILILNENKNFKDLASTFHSWKKKFFGKFDVFLKTFI